MGGLPFWEWVQQNSSDLVNATIQHALLTLYVLVTATVIALLLAIVGYRIRWIGDAMVSASVVAFTVPSVAAFGLLVPIFGLSLPSVFVPLVIYALNPTIRNAIVGLRGVDPFMVDAARGLGMSNRAILFRVELPLAWPVIVTGIRVGAQLTIGLVVIAALILDIGLGSFIFDSLANLGSVNTFSEAVAGSILAATLGIVVDLLFLLIRRYTTPRGLRV